MREILIRFWETYNGTLLNVLGKVITSIAIIFAGKLFLRWSKKLVKRLDATIASVMKIVIRYAIIIVCIVMILNVFGINTASLIALLGAAGVAIGLALKDTLSNIACGIILLFLKIYRKGDFIEFGSTMGSVKDIDLFTTTLETGDGIFIAVPNSSIWGLPLKNYSRNDKRRLDLIASIAYSDSIDRAFAVMQDIINNEDRFLTEPAPQVLVHSLGDSSVNIMLRAWTSTKVYWQVYWYQMRNIKEKIEEAGLTIPFPQQDIHIITEK